MTTLYLASCPNLSLPQELPKEIGQLMLNYQDLTLAQKLDIDHRIKTGYYKTVLVAKKGNLSFAKAELLLWKVGKTTYLVFMVNRIAAFLFKRYFI